ncbi:MAG: lipopolysaccharide kinase InaA family protein [Phycisphaerae bacterium]|jgi:tRNA A-37 threonylcarbamoyl transferase component Bud32
MGEKQFMPADMLEVIRRNNLDTVASAFSYAQARDLTRAGLGHRRYFRIELTDGQGRPLVLYMKRYEREPLAWRLRRLLTYGPGQSPASVEMECVRSANQANLPTIQHAYYQEERDLLGVRRSYILLSAVPGVALEHCFAEFMDRNASRPEVLEDFTRRLAELVAALHRSGYVHRDLYASHIYLDDPDGAMRLSLIDVARMFRPRCCVFRWRVKDLAQLKYSMPPAWIERHWDAFFQDYLRLVGISNGRRYAAAVTRKVAKMRRRIGDYPAPAAGA